MRHLVTGGAGFIGSHLVERLLARGDRVVVLDDLSTGRLANLAAVAGHPDLEVVIGSVEDRTLVARAARGVDRIHHLAARVGVELVVGEPVASIRTIVDGTQAVLEAARVDRIPVVLASSSEVYGDSAPVPLRESVPVVPGRTDEPRGGYACAKALSEWFGFAFMAEHGVPVSVARLFNTVGPRQTGRYGMVLPRFCEQARRGAPMTVHGDGAQTRCFAHVADVVDALIALGEQERAVGRVVNVGSDTETSILELAVLVRDLADSRSPIECRPMAELAPARVRDTRRRVPDLALLRALVGTVPATPLARIVRDTLDSCCPSRRGADLELAGAAALLPPGRDGASTSPE
jgi:UDP-glucose 4-epimerase